MASCAVCDECFNGSLLVSVPAQVMTDLFFPESQLLSTTLRPEDHINTGFAARSFQAPESFCMLFGLREVDNLGLEAVLEGVLTGKLRKSSSL